MEVEVLGREAMWRWGCVEVRLCVKVRLCGGGVLCEGEAM